MSDPLMAAIGGVCMGVVVGWLLPVVHRLTWPTVLASSAAFAILAIGLFWLVGLPASLAAMVGIASGIWLHVGFLEYVTGRPAIAKEE